MLYTGVLLLALSVFRAPAARRAMEPALAAGAFDRDRLRAGRPAAAGDRRARSLAQRRRPPRAADHLLERRGRAGRYRPRAVRATRRRPHAPRGRPRGGRRRPPSRSAPASTSPTRAARSPSRRSGSSCSSRWPRRAAQLRAAALALGTSVIAAAAMSALRGVASLKGPLERADHRRRRSGWRSSPPSRRRRRSLPSASARGATRRWRGPAGSHRPPRRSCWPRRSGSSPAAWATVRARPSSLPARARGG